eukprot:1152123-Pelagomonas_calceolata.AAC.1
MMMMLGSFDDADAAQGLGAGGAWAHFCSLVRAQLTVSIQPSAIHKLSLSYNEPIHWSMHAPGGRPTLNWLPLLGCLGHGKLVLGR